MSIPGRRRRKSLFPMQRLTEPGAAPGTLVARPSHPKPVVRVFGYGPDDVLETEVHDPGDVAGYLGRWPVVWIDVDALGDLPTVQALGEIFGLHRLALEDVLNPHQRPKVEQYDDYQFLVARMIDLEVGELTTEQVSIFHGAQFVVTFQERPGDCLDALRARLRKGSGRLRRAGPDYLVYTILDTILDHYFPVLEQLGDRLEQLEAEVVEQPTPVTVRRILAIKSDLVTLRRAVWPTREAVNVLLREPGPFYAEETRIHLRDCADHAFQLMDLVETYRELAAGLMEVYLSSQSHRMNEVIKVLTIIATIFIPLTFLAGVWGMNFDPASSPWNMPELVWKWGYPASLGLMAGIGLGLVLYFRRRGWIDSSPRGDDD